jgi:hypothetical protein
LILQHRPGNRWRSWDTYRRNNFEVSGFEVNRYIAQIASSNDVGETIMIKVTESNPTILEIYTNKT